MIDWSAPRLAALRAAMHKPSQYRKALGALDELCYLRAGEAHEHPVFIARCASLAAAVDWIVFVLHVAGHDAGVASDGSCVLAFASFGLSASKESCQPLLPAVAPAMAAMKMHRRDAYVTDKVVKFLHTMMCSSDKLREALRQLGVRRAVRKAGKLHRGHDSIQERVQNCRRMLAES